MIGLTQALFAYSISTILDLDERFAVVGALIPSVSMTLIYFGPLQYEGVLLSFTSALFFSAIVYFGFDEEKSKSVFTGYSCSLLLESLTFSYLPIFYPIKGFQGLGLFSSFDPLFNILVVSFSIAVIVWESLKT
ncbi:MAG: hypothetical protein R6V35_04455 [Candidatus Nanohaloarchaea archaeon]